MNNKRPMNDMTKAVKSVTDRLDSEKRERDEAIRQLQELLSNKPDSGKSASPPTRK